MRNKKKSNPRLPVSNKKKLHQTIHIESKCHKNNNPPEIKWNSKKTSFLLTASKKNTLRNCDSDLVTFCHSLSPFSLNISMIQYAFGEGKNTKFEINIRFMIVFNFFFQNLKCIFLKINYCVGKVTLSALKWNNFLKHLTISDHVAGIKSLFKSGKKLPSFFLKG